MATLEDKRTFMDQKMREREESRQNVSDQRRKAKEDGENPEESAVFFNTKFQAELAAIQQQLSECVQHSGDALATHFDTITARVQALQKYVTECSLFLNQYDLKTSSDTIKMVEGQIQSERERLLPRRKFAFKGNKKSTAKASDSADAPQLAPAPAPAPAPASLSAHATGFANLSGQRLVLSGDALAGKDVELVNLTDCQIFLEGHIGAMHISKLTNCRLLAGPVARSVFMADCTACVVAVACQQLRIHTTITTDFYIHVTARAIIESCDRVRFAPYAWHYPTLDKDYEAASLDRGTNFWAMIDDFHWLRTDAPSPHWSLVPEADREPSLSK